MRSTNFGVSKTRKTSFAFPQSRSCSIDYESRDVLLSRSIHRIYLYLICYVAVAETAIIWPCICTWNEAKSTNGRRPTDGSAPCRPNEPDASAPVRCATTAPCPLWSWRFTPSRVETIRRRFARLLARPTTRPHLPLLPPARTASRALTDSSAKVSPRLCALASDFVQSRSGCHRAAVGRVKCSDSRAESGP